MRAAILDHFVRTGRAPALEHLAAAAGTSVEAARAGLHALAGTHAVVLQPGTDAIWMAMPFSGVETPFRVRAGVPDGTAGAWWANCAWDALGIPAMLAGAGMSAAQAPMSVTTACPACDRSIALSVCAGAASPDDAVRAEGNGPAHAVVHVAVAASHWWDDIGFT